MRHPAGTFIRWITRSAAGVRQPGLYGELRSDLLALQRAGIGVLVSLTAETIPERELTRCGIQGCHFPIVGMGVPHLGATLLLSEELSQVLSHGTKIAFHCTAGVGRTGMMLACHLVWRGEPADAAIRRVRQSIPRAIQTAGQVAFVYRFAEVAAAPRQPRSLVPYAGEPVNTALRFSLNAVRPSR